MTQSEKAGIFHNLHHDQQLLILPNIWEPLGAKILEDVGYPAIATASASVAWSHGLDDGERIALPQYLSLIRKIVNSVTLPVSVDFESGYADNLKKLADNVSALLDVGAVGINIEDTDKATGELYTKDAQCRRLAVIRDAAGKKGIQLFINARTDVNLRRKQGTSDEEVLQDCLERGLAYKSAGADGFYPITISDRKMLKAFVKNVGLPINVVAVPGIPSLKELEEIGVARLSLGPGFLRIALRAMQEVAMDLKHGKNINRILENPLTSDYVRNRLLNQVS